MNRSSPAIQWIVDATPVADMLTPVFVAKKVREHRAAQRAFHTAKRADPGLKWRPEVAMIPLLTGDEYRDQVGLVSMCISGEVVVHADPSFDEFSYLLLLRPGPYRVIDCKVDLATPQPRGSLICFRDHSKHGLMHRRGDVQAACDALSTKGYVYDRFPAQSWLALGFDHAERLTPEAGIAEMLHRLRLTREQAVAASRAL